MSTSLYGGGPDEGRLPGFDIEYDVSVIGKNGCIQLQVAVWPDRPQVCVDITSQSDRIRDAIHGARQRVSLEDV
jgi:hypothetical protein